MALLSKGNIKKDDRTTRRGSGLAPETLFWTADHSRLVPEDSEEAAYLYARAGRPIDVAEAARAGYTGSFDAAPPEVPDADPKTAHELAHGGETPAEAAAARHAMFQGKPAGQTKAIEQAPENKGTGRKKKAV